MNGLRQRRRDLEAAPVEKITRQHEQIIDRVAEAALFEAHAAACAARRAVGQLLRRDRRVA